MNWECPNCDAWLTAPTNRMHYCPGLAGLATYFVLSGTKVKVEVYEREDYIGHEIVPLDDNNRPVMSITTTRDDGQDCVVFASTAVGEGRGLV